MAYNKNTTTTKGKGKHKREFGEGPIYTITNYILWFLMGNIYFLLLNIPLLYLLLVLISNGKSTLPDGFAIVFSLCCIPMGPAATALFSVMGKLVREKDINITRDFFKAYKANFLQSLFIWTLGILVIIILASDVRIIFAYNYPRILIYILYVFIAFIFILGLYALPIISRFYLKSKDVLKFSAYYAIKKIHITIMNIFSFVIVGFVFFKITTFIILFISSIICYMIMFYEQKILLEIEEKLKIDGDKSIQES
jgi:uncharacterized membrane protein YesL